MWCEIGVQEKRDQEEMVLARQEKIIIAPQIG